MPVNKSITICSLNWVEQKTGISIILLDSKNAE